MTCWFRKSASRILDVDVLANLVSRSVYGDAAFVERLAQVTMYGVAVGRPSSVQRAIAKNRVIEAVATLILFDVYLCGLLAGAIEASRVRIDIDRRRECEPRDRRRASCFEDVDTAEDIELDGLRGLRGRVVQIGQPGEVVHNVLIGNRRHHLRRVEDVTEDEPLVRLKECGRPAVEDGDTMAGSAQRIGHVAAQEAGAAKDNGLHE